MWHDESLDGEWFEKLAKIDEKIAMAVAAGGCVRCGGPLHRSNYRRKPRGGHLVSGGEAFTLRYSLCCGREGCRKRALPPSLRFLGRRVYLEAVVLIATVYAMLARTMRNARDTTGVPVRTLRRWRAWWTEAFPKLDAWAMLRAQFVPPPPDEADLPKSLLDRVAASLDVPTVGEVLGIAGRLLSPVTTRSVSDGSRFVAVAIAH